MTHFCDKVAIVTGAASGFGRALAEQLAAAGAVVVLADKDGEKARAVAAEIQARGGRASGVALDVMDAAAVEALVEETARARGGLDLLFNNAGITIVGEVRDTTLADWKRVLDVNLLGVVHGVHAAYAVMAR